MTETPDDAEFDDGELFAHLASQGLDVDDEEALEYAAEIIQTEREAFFARHRAFKKGFKGSKGKGSGKSSTPPSSRHFDVQGQLSLSERQQRVQSLKSRTTCRKCGQVGHWSGDFICPKNNKGGKSGPGSSASSSAPTKSSASAGRGAKDGKPRTVYFGIKSDDGYSRKSYRAMRYNAVPPPSCLSDGQVPPEQATGSSPGEWSVVSDGHHMTQDELDNIMLVEALGVPEIRDDELQSMVDFVARNESVATPDARLLMLEALQHQQQHGHVALQLLPRQQLSRLCQDERPCLSLRINLNKWFHQHHLCHQQRTHQMEFLKLMLDVNTSAPRLEDPMHTTPSRSVWTVKQFFFVNAKSCLRGQHPRQRLQQQPQLHR